jgi:hypothetical protein
MQRQALWSMKTEAKLELFLTVKIHVDVLHDTQAHTRLKPVKSLQNDVFVICLMAIWGS